MPITRRSFPSFSLTNKVEVSIIRYSKGEYIKGRWQKGTPQTVLIEANVQPLQFRDIFQMDESDRTKEWIKLYSVSEMKTAVEGAEGTDADIIIWKGNQYKVMRVKNYEMGVLDHYMALAARVPISAKA